MTATVHQLRATPADRDSAWERYADLARAMEAEPRLRRDREHVDATLKAFAEYQRLFNLCFERGAGA